GPAAAPAPAGSTPAPAPAPGGAAPATGPRPARAPIGPAAFRTGEGAEDRLIAQVAYALAAEAGTPPQSQDALRGLRDQATAALSDFAFRYLHNRTEEIRREAAEEALAKAPRPPGFLMMLLANLVALAVAGAAVWALATPDLLARLTAL
ncbi:MAG: hypothetical protein K2X74_20620, partial [Acetobacteraceae bacterium]|nr:hypothetical protein [Acetobacteraceae bacterium]